MHVPLAQHQHELVLGELGSTSAKRHAVKRQVPGRVPRIFPLVRHRDDVGVIQMRPLVIAAMQTRFGGGAGWPDRPRASVHVVVVELLAPEHAGKGLAHDSSAHRRERSSEMMLA